MIVRRNQHKIGQGGKGFLKTEPKIKYMELNHIIKNFNFPGRLCSVIRHTSGHINDTYTIRFILNSNKKRRCILQKINQNVFPEPEKVMENIEKVTGHLRGKIIERGGDPSRESLSIVPSAEGKTFYKDTGGHYWRAYVFIENTRSYERTENPSHIYGAGKAIGKFQEMLMDLALNSLHETLPGFHNTAKRFEDFTQSVQRDLFRRVAMVRREIAFVEKRVGRVSCLVNLLREGRLPLRIVHNDTKFSNILFDNSTGDSICMLDLDTVMPGSALYDFGDAVRSAARAPGSGGPGLPGAGMDMTLYEQFCRGYLESAGRLLISLEKKLLPFSTLLMTLECGMRYLTDYLNGDIYFRISREKHNLDRARLHFKLLEDMENKFQEMKEVTENYC